MSRNGSAQFWEYRPEGRHVSPVLLFPRKLISEAVRIAKKCQSAGIPDRRALREWRWITARGNPKEACTFAWCCALLGIDAHKERMRILREIRAHWELSWREANEPDVMLDEVTELLTAVQSKLRDLGLRLPILKQRARLTAEWEDIKVWRRAGHSAHQLRVFRTVLQTRHRRLSALVQAQQPVEAICTDEGEEACDVNLQIIPALEPETYSPSSLMAS